MNFQMFKLDLEKAAEPETKLTTSSFRIWNRSTGIPSPPLALFIRNTFESVLMRWVNLKPIIQSEISQKEKNKYRVLTRIYGI